MRVEIVEVSPRDGLQSAASSVPAPVKAELVSRAVAAGLRRVEVTAFVNPRAVPQMADAEVVASLLRRRDGVTYEALVLNERGFDRALDAGIANLNVVIPATDTFGTRNQGAGWRQGVDRFLSVSERAKSAQVHISATIATAFGCPFEGEVSVERVIEIARLISGVRPQEISLADTIGAAVPSQVEELVASIRNVLPDVVLRCHFHNSRNAGYANAVAAVRSGVGILDASLGGIGGCPFAPGATGNIATEDLTFILERMGHATGVDLSAAIDAGRWLVSETAIAGGSQLSKAGPFPPSLRPISATR